MSELFLQIQDVFSNLFNNESLKALLSDPKIATAAFIALTMIVFTETGLLIGFFLPGDSLLVTAGFAAWHANWNVPALIGILSIAAIVGDSVGYWIGYKAGPKLFNREKSFFFRPGHLLAAQAFYEKHGTKTIILARFMPFVRTFAPVVAGIGKMDYRRFITYNIIGGIGWVVSMILLGYALTPILDPMFKPLFGHDFEIGKHLEKVILLVIFLSIMPILFAGLREWLRRRATRKTIPDTLTQV